MNKRSSAIALSLALYRFANQMDQWEKEGIRRTEAQKAFPTRYTFWFPQGPRNFKTTDQIRTLASKIAKQEKAK
jgi:hypothetical protein